MNVAHNLAIEKYNASLVEVKHVSGLLKIFRIKADQPLQDFNAGQFVSLGLGSWESRLESCQQEITVKENHLGRRAYSICSPIFAEDGSLFDHNNSHWLEFYITLVTQGIDELHAPYLTPRLFNLDIGDRLYMSSKVTGHYILQDIKPKDDIILLSTGTGQAPHNTMLAELLRDNHKGQIVVIECNRSFDMCGYANTLTKLAEQFPNVHYRQLSTREGDDPIRIQQFIANDRLEKEFNIQITPETSKFFLCGNPAMIGIPSFKGGQITFTASGGTVELLVKKYGLAIHHGHTPGQIYYEKYW